MIEGYFAGAGDGSNAAQYARTDISINREFSLRTKIKIYGTLLENARIEVPIGDRVSGNINSEFTKVAEFDTSGQNESLESFPFPFSVIAITIRQTDSNNPATFAILRYAIDQ